MNDKPILNYRLIHYRPKLERGEFINIGIVWYYVDENTETVKFLHYRTIKLNETKAILDFIQRPNPHSFRSWHLKKQFNDQIRALREKLDAIAATIYATQPSIELINDEFKPSEYIIHYSTARTFRKYDNYEEDHFNKYVN